jgi:hypothetical protein
VFSLAIPVLVFVAGFIYNSVQAHKEKRTMKDVLRSTVMPTLIGAGITLVAWLCLFGWSIAATIYRDHQDLVSSISKSKHNQEQSDKEIINGLQRTVKELTNKAPQPKMQCWSQNITLAPPRNIPSAMSASEVVVFCNQERKAPLTVRVDYDQEPILAGPIAFAEGRILSTTEMFSDKQLFFKLDSPSIKPYQIFIVTVYGGGEKPPLSQRVVIESINPER